MIGSLTAGHRPWLSGSMLASRPVMRASMLIVTLLRRRVCNSARLNSNSAAGEAS